MRWLFTLQKLTVNSGIYKTIYVEFSKALETTQTEIDKLNSSRTLIRFGPYRKTECQDQA